MKSKTTNTTKLATHKEIKRVAETAASKVKSWSPLPWDELHSIAMLTIFEAGRTFKPDHGTPFTAYAYMAAVRECERKSEQELRRSTRELAVALHGDRRRLDQARKDEQISGVTRILRRAATDDPTADQTLDAEEWRAGVQDTLRDLLTPAEIRGVLPLILRDKTAQELATERGVSVSRVYNDSYAVRGRLKASPALRALWSNR
jgi:hypothetical protein